MARAMEVQRTGQKIIHISLRKEVLAPAKYSHLLAAKTTGRIASILQKVESGVATKMLCAPNEEGFVCIVGTEPCRCVSMRSINSMFGSETGAVYWWQPYKYTIPNAKTGLATLHLTEHVKGNLLIQKCNSPRSFSQPLSLLPSRLLTAPTAPTAPPRPWRLVLWARLTRLLLVLVWLLLVPSLCCCKWAKTRAANCFLTLADSCYVLSLI